MGFVDLFVLGTTPSPSYALVPPNQNGTMAKGGIRMTEKCIRKNTALCVMLRVLRLCEQKSYLAA